MPFAAYVPTKSELVTLTKASNALINSCVARFGFKYHVDFPSDEDLYSKIREGTSSPLTLAQAEQYGYKSPAQGAQDTAQETQSEQSSSDQGSSMTQALNQVLSGGSELPKGATLPPGAATPHSAVGKEINGEKVPEGGCQGEAQRKLAKGGPNLKEFGSKGLDPLNVVLAMRDDSHTKGQQDPVYVKMRKAWSSCMKTAGYTYSSFDAAWESPEWAKSATATDREKSVATADVRCRLKANYVGVTDAVNLAYEKRAVEDNAELLNAVKEYNQAQLRNAAKVV